MRSNFHEGRWWMSVARGRGTLLEADDTIVSGEAVRVACSSWRKKKDSSRAREEEEEREREREDRRVESVSKEIYVYVYTFSRQFFSRVKIHHPVVRYFSIRNVEVIWVSPFWASVSVCWLWCCSSTPAMPSAYAIIQRGKWPLHHRRSSRIALLAPLPPVDARRRGSRAR